MTTTRVQTIACAVCATRSVHTLLTSSGAYGSYDLDLRPPPLLRHTMNLWLQQCPTCRYVNDRLDHRLGDAAAIVYSPEYRAIAQLDQEPELVQRFKRHALLLADQPLLSARALLHAAWVCDDHWQPELACACRDECADLMIGVDYTALGEAGLRSQLVLVDVLRRARRVDEASDWIERLLEQAGLPESMSKVLHYERRLLQAGDVGCHEVEMALQGQS